MKMDAGRQCFLTIAIILATSLWPAASAGVGRGQICRDQCRECIDQTSYPNQGSCQSDCVHYPLKFEDFCLQFQTETCDPLSPEYTPYPSTASNRYNIGTTVTVGCSAGFIVNAYSYIFHDQVTSATCQEDGTWTTHYLPCVPIVPDHAADGGGNHFIAVGDTPATLTTPGFPLQYANDLVIYWLLETDPGNFIHITFKFFVVESFGTDCTGGDHLHVFDGNAAINHLSGRLCGDRTNDNIDFCSTGNAMYIYFLSDFCCRQDNAGIEIEYEGVSQCPIP